MGGSEGQGKAYAEGSVPTHRHGADFAERSYASCGRGEASAGIRYATTSLRHASSFYLLSEGMGFEPMGARSSAELAIRFFRPLRHPSKLRRGLRPCSAA